MRAPRILAIGLAALPLSLLPDQPARADCGSIPFKPWVSVFEPNQRALIAFDGREEILLLSTDLSSSEPTNVLEVIPFPNEPAVKKGDVDVFYQATELINRKLFPTKSGRFGGAGGFGGLAMEPGPPPPAGEVTFHKRIGAHDVSVTRVLDATRFVDWVDDYLRRAGVDNPTIPVALREVVEEYLRDGFDWFVFNVVELGTETLTKEALQYRFKTRSLYYPLRITRTETGDTTVRLLILSPQLVRMPDLGRVKVELVHRPVTVDRGELKDLDKDLHGFLRNYSRTLLRIWEIRGPLAGFQRDVVTGYQ